MIINKAKCCGCGLCAEVCPKKAISMESDEKGFLYPVINSECIECGLCERVCMFSHAKLSDKNDVKVFTAQFKDSEAVKNSSSGGIFTALSDYVLDAGGVVYGTILDDSMKAVVARADNPSMRDKMRGSKYIWSDMRAVYDTIKQDVETKRLVMYTGTPCQCDAVKKFAGDADNLLLVDFVCHGTPSPMVFADYLEYVCRLFGKSKVKKYLFRSKKFGYAHNQFGYAEVGRNRTYLVPPSIDLYYAAFLDNYSLRNSCFECPYTHTQRVSDITIGDAMNKKLQVGFVENMGVSLMYINTPKGERLFEAFSDNMLYYNRELSECMLPQLKYPTKKPAGYDMYWQTYQTNGLRGTKKVIFNSKKRIISNMFEIMLRILPGNTIEKIMSVVWK